MLSIVRINSQYLESIRQWRNACIIGENSVFWNDRPLCLTNVRSAYVWEPQFGLYSMLTQNVIKIVINGN